MEFVFGILGQTALRLHGKVAVKWSSPQVQKVLAALLTAPNRRVPVDELVRWAWLEDQPPSDPLTTIHQYATRLRHVFEEHEMPARLSVGKSGCLLEVDRALIDYVVFSDLMARARRFQDQGQHDRACAESAAALRLWRDETLADLRTEYADQWRTRWTRNTWLPATAFAVTEQLAVGQAESALAMLSELEAAHPGELSLAKLMIRALFAAGRADEATGYFRAMYRNYAENGETRTADALRAVHDEEYSRGVGTTSNKIAARSAVPAEPSALWHVPMSIEDVIGRDELFGALDAATTDATGRPRRGVVLVNGGPGVGKTTAAAHWASRVKDRYRDGVVMLDLRGQSQATRADAAEVVDTVLSLLDYPVDQVVSPIVRATKLARLLEQRSMLVILDNVRSTDQVESLLGVLAPCTVLIVSRWWLKTLSSRVTGPVLTVAPLQPRHAWALLTRRIGARVRREQHGAAQLVRLCQGNPLALTLVADRALARAGTQLPTLAEQLRDSELLLDLGDEGDYPHVSLRSIFALSYQALGPAEQRVFAVIGLHPGAEVTGDVIAAADGRPAGAVRRSLDVLVAAHLVEHPGDLARFRVSDLAHLYATSVAQELPDADAARRRMFEHYMRRVLVAHDLIYPHNPASPLTLAEPLGADPGISTAVEARQWVLRERGNLVEVVSAAAEARLHAIAGVIAAYTAQVYLMQGHFADAISCLTIAVRSADQLAAASEPPPVPTASHLNDLGVVVMLAGDDAAAGRHLARALELVEAQDIPIGRIAVMQNLARLHLRAGRAAEAAAMCRQTLSLARELGQPEPCASAAHRLADVLVDTSGGEQEALALYTEALRHREQMGDTTARLRTHTALAALLTQMGRLTEAGEHCRRAAALVDDCPDLPAVMKFNTVHAQLQHVRGHDRIALRYAHRAVELADRSQHATGQARALAVLAGILRDHGNREDARTLWRRAADLYRGRARIAKAEQVEALLAELDADEPFIPATRDGEQGTVAIPSPRVRLLHGERD
ncbi:AfsR/SARP family transcriptional regulator [Amycolatopsis saalfeldensis]|uniref:DNA-binding transcriptional activator of the SARP family n=1 Tax=Amycolatopsis saalfeldensis TaxID=394193 RepID=A0A1H8XIB5_9PSEU|nr:BTAD domain-containing putative transcriptional regulator [Amycolatopsis saalfeldensis]SEP39626.1 DNA-binding transcriptional activator of the SARP family [Amycolatopsis saalfeldensis]